jgi:predicted Na+-dependent transporter
MGCMPGGTTSNIFTYFSKGALALSIMMTICSTLVAVAMVPLLLEFYSQLKGLPAEYTVPAGNVAQVLFVLLVPTLIGMLLRKWNANVGAIIEMIGGALGIVVILFLMISWVPRNYTLLATTPWQVYFGAIGLGVLAVLLPVSVRIGWLIPLVTFGLAGLVGMEFPAACRLDTADAPTTAGRLFTADFVGACLGALLASTLLIPLVGVAAACWITAGLNVIAALALWWRR